MWFVTYAYEVNTLVVYYVHIHMLHMRMRSIPRFLCKWYAFGVICVRGQYLNCVLRLTLIFVCFVCVEAICLDYVSWLHHCWLLDVMIFLIYAYVVTVYVFDRIHVINRHMCIYVITWFLYRMLSFSVKGSWWPSSHFCENGVVTILFSTTFFVDIPFGHFNSFT